MGNTLGSILTLILGAIALPFAAGCRETITENLRIGATLRFEPVDGTTAHGTNDILVHVMEEGFLVDDAAFVDLGARLRLRTWPEAQPVAITTQPGVGAFPGDKVLRVMPAVTLEDRWHVLALDSFPDWYWRRTPLSDGTVGVRFRPGSHPRLSLLEFCQNEPTGMKAGVSFSEPLVSPPAGAVSVAVGGRALDCDRYHEESQQILFLCGELTSPATVTISVATGIVATTGVALDATTSDVILPRLSPGICHPFSPPI